MTNVNHLPRQTSRLARRAQPIRIYRVISITIPQQIPIRHRRRPITTTTTTVAVAVIIPVISAIIIIIIINMTRAITIRIERRNGMNLNPCWALNRLC